MSKRAPSGQFKARDIKPQLFRGSLIAAAANTFEEAVFNTPVIPEAGWVMEILRINVVASLAAFTDLTVGDSIDYALYDRSVADTPKNNDPGVIISDTVRAGPTATMMRDAKQYDMTDGNGNGLLYGKRSMILGFAGINLSTAGRVDFSILYRLVQVSAEELIGIITD